MPQFNQNIDNKQVNQVINRLVYDISIQFFLCGSLSAHVRFDSSLRNETDKMGSGIAGELTLPFSLSL